MDAHSKTKKKKYRKNIEMEKLEFFFFFLIFWTLGKVIVGVSSSSFIALLEAVKEKLDKKKIAYTRAT